MGGSVSDGFRGINLGESFDDVIEAAGSGKEWAWSSLYGAVAGPVTGFLRARGASDPEELAGDVFFELARSIARFEGDQSAFRTYVFVIAYRRLAEERQRKVGEPRSLLADDVLDKLRSASQLDGIEVEDSTAEEVRRAFEILTPEQRDVLSLRIIAGLTLQETASVINRGVMAVKSIQRRGLSKIRTNQVLQEPLS